MAMLPLLVAFLLAFSSQSSALQWTNCATASAPVTVREVTLTPDPAVTGEEFELTLPASTASVLNGGTVQVFVFFHGIPIHYERKSLCGKTPCPISPGEFSLSQKQSLPSITPAGTYMVRLSAVDDEGKQLFCERISFQIVKSKKTGQSVLADAVDAFTSLVAKHQEDVDHVAEAAQAAWKFSEETKSSLKEALRSQQALGRRGGVAA